MARLRDPRHPTRTKRRGTVWWRWLITMFLGCSVLVAAYYYFSGTGYRLDAGLFPVSTQGITLDDPPGRTLGKDIRDFTPADEALNSTQRDIVAQLARRHVGSPLRGGEPDDLRILQRIVDLKVLRRDETRELQALGVALGDVFRKQFALRWVVVRDEYGRSRALQVGDTDNLVFPVTMISKRVEAGLPVDITTIYADVAEALERS